MSNTEDNDSTLLSPVKATSGNLSPVLGTIFFFFNVDKVERIQRKLTKMRALEK